MWSRKKTSHKQDENKVQMKKDPLSDVTQFTLHNTEEMGYKGHRAEYHRHPSGKFKTLYSSYFLFC